MNTSDQQTALKQAAPKRIKDSRPQRQRRSRGPLLSRIGSSCDLDVGRDGYCGPMIVAEPPGAAQTVYLARQRAAIGIVDAGCGTGLVGVQLERLDFRLIDGFDLSEEMAERARQTRVYRHVRGDVDLSGPLSSVSYDIAVCRGVFTLGHVRPDALRELARVTLPNGFVVASTRKSYAETASLRRGAASAGCEHPCAGTALTDGRYVAEEEAHYCVFQVPERASAPEERGYEHATANLAGETRSRCKGQQARAPTHALQEFGFFYIVELTPRKKDRTSYPASRSSQLPVKYENAQILAQTKVYSCIKIS
ncbi:class I SAM-dependent DNA methyltransferase [Mesorhizobium amorphae]|uniref:class I SAM-dependent DNA methyltransferase n=1 Tax=Mesorhizobium amorphae TaxID=71433 RepID=UPI001FEE60FA|nr:class I SAM-dependent methyltransferase [Mesorhizobium amorphae]